MLVLARKIDETIKIGEHVTITVLQVKGRMVKIGISAPRDVRVMRGELTPFEGAADASLPESTVLEATLDISQFSTADALVSEAIESSESEESDTVAAQLQAAKSAHGLAHFRKQRERRLQQVRRAGRPTVMAATAN